MKRFTLLTAALALSGLANFAQAKTLETVASFTVIADMVHNVGGDHVHVTSLIGPNGDPHVYEPTPNDAQALKDIQAAYPDREVIGIMTREVIYGGGNIHCITQQQPKARCK